MKSVLLFLLPLVIFLYSCSSSEKEEKVEVMKDDYMKMHPDTMPSMFGRNNMEFKDGRKMTAGSAFLLNYDTHYLLVTARHLLGPDGGLDPEVKRSELEKKLKSWSMTPHKDKGWAKAKKIITTGDEDSDDDLLIAENESRDAYCLHLETFSSSLSMGDTLYVICCEYKDKDCRQKFYPIIYQKSEGNSLLFKGLEGIDFRGFSGAPVVNTGGYAVGCFRGSARMKTGEEYLIATNIRLAGYFLRKAFPNEKIEE